MISVTILPNKILKLEMFFDLVILYIHVGGKIHQIKYCVLYMTLLYWIESMMNELLGLSVNVAFIGRRIKEMGL